MKTRGDTISHGEMFRRGFYGGFGLWCSFSLLNFIFVLVALCVLAWFGIIGVAVDAWSPAKKNISPGIRPDRPAASAPVTHRAASPSR